METIKSIYIFFIKELIYIMFCLIETLFKSSAAKNLEIVALRSQLSILQQQIENNKIPKSRPTPAFRQLWVVLAKIFSNWKYCLILVKPDTVIKWHRRAFKLHWSYKSRKRGRPPISSEIITIIKKLHKENPLLSPEKIHEKLMLNIFSMTTTQCFLIKKLKPF